MRIYPFSYTPVQFISTGRVIIVFGVSCFGILNITGVLGSKAIETVLPSVFTVHNNVDGWKDVKYTVIPVGSAFQLVGRIM